MCDESPIRFSDVLLPTQRPQRYALDGLARFYPHSGTLRPNEIGANQRFWPEIGGFMHAQIGDMLISSTSERDDDAQRAGESFAAWQRRIDPRTRAKHHKSAAAEAEHRARTAAKNRPKNRAARAARKANR